MDITTDSKLLLTNFGELVEVPSLPWPVNYPHLFVRKQPKETMVSTDAFIQYLPPAIQTSVPSRRYEYLLGRLATARLLSELEVPVKQRWIGQDGRRPVWPHGVRGSISHTSELLIVSAGYCTSEVESIGIDIECVPINEQTTTALCACFTGNEIQKLRKIEHGLVTGFSAKEAIFKCFSEEANKYFDFLDVEIVEVDLNRKILKIKFLEDISIRLRRGLTRNVAYCLLEKHIWTGTIWEG